MLIFSGRVILGCALDLTLTIANGAGWLSEYQTLIAALIALVGAAVGVVALNRQTQAQAQIAAEALAHADARERAQSLAERAALASLLHADLIQLGQDAEQFIFSVDNAQAAGICGRELAHELTSYSRSLLDFNLALTWRDLSRLDVRDVMQVRCVKHLHAQLLREISHQSEAISVEVPLLKMTGFQIDAEESALTAVSERAQDLKAEIDSYTRDLAERYHMPKATSEGLGGSDHQQDGDRRVERKPALAKGRG